MGRDLLYCYSCTCHLAGCSRGENKDWILSRTLPNTHTSSFHLQHPPGYNLQHHTFFPAVIRLYTSFPNSLPKVGMRGTYNIYRLLNCIFLQHTAWHIFENNSSVNQNVPFYEVRPTSSLSLLRVSLCLSIKSIFIPLFLFCFSLQYFLQMLLSCFFS